MRHWGLLAAVAALAGCTVQMPPVSVAEVPISQASDAQQEVPSPLPSPSPDLILPSEVVTPFPSPLASPPPEPVRRSLVTYTGPTFTLKYPSDWTEKTGDNEIVTLTNSTQIGLFRVTTQRASLSLLESAAAERVANGNTSSAMKFSFIDGSQAYEHSAQIGDEYRTFAVTYGVIRGGVEYRVALMVSSIQPDAPAFARDADAIMASWRWSEKEPEATAPTSTPAPTEAPTYDARLCDQLRARGFDGAAYGCP